MREVPDLPAGVEVYTLAADGTALLATGRGAGELTGYLRFIDDGQRARYFIGDPQTSPRRPSIATYKLGVVRPHSAFTPHAHGGEHFVLSLGYAACGMYDADRDEAVQVRLTPGMMIRIPALVPHSFANRGAEPLLVLAANTGYGIDHEDYAITVAAAETRAVEEAGAAGGPDYPALAKALRRLEGAPAPGRTTGWERLAARLRRLATRLEGTR